MDFSLKLRLSQLMSNYSSEELDLLLNTNELSVIFLFIDSFRPVYESGKISAAKTGST